MDLEKASYNLSQLEIKINTGNLIIDVNWFRRACWSGKWIINRHSHSSYEFHFISSGRCKVLLDDYEFTVSEGEFYINKPGISHIQRNIDGEEHSEYCLCCDLNLLDERDSEELYILKILNEVSCGPIKDILGIKELFEKALVEAYIREVGFYNNIKGLVIMIVFSAVQSIAKEFKIKYPIPIIQNKNDNRLLQIEKYIEDNLSYPIAVTDLAEHMHLSEKQLCRIIVEKKGISTKQYIKNSKLKKAKDLLKNSDTSIKEIASLLGFSSEYYFSQYFKREEGFPPGTFRRNTQNV